MDVAAPAADALQGIDDGGIGRETDPAVQPVAVDGGDQRPVAGRLRLLLDDAGQGHHLPDAPPGGAPGEERADVAFEAPAEGPDQGLDDLPLAGADGEL